ncbi:hypothetical protein FS749_000842, partial [Ceratobasidium sp. UAMH 11750]
MSNLPPELVRLLADYCPNLSSLALVNRHYNRRITPALYQNVILDNISRLKAFSRTMRTGRRFLRDYPRSLNIGTSVLLDQQLSQLAAMTKQLLMLTANITELSLFLPRFVVKHLLQEPQYPFALRWLCIEPLDSDGFTTFLETQPHIEHGRFLYHSVYLSNPDVLPRLKSIEGTSVTIRNLAPRRPISIVRFDNPVDDTQLDTIHHALKQSLVPLTHLSIRVRMLLFPWYHGISDLFSGLDYCRESLKELAIDLYSIIKISANVPLYSFLTCAGAHPEGFNGVRKCISAFSKLEKFKLDSPITWQRDLSPEFRDSIPELSQFQ